MVAIKDLLVAYQGDKGSQNALKFGLQMARKYGAVLTGVHVHTSDQFEARTRQWIPESVLETMRQAEQAAVKEIEKSFRSVVAEAGGGIEHEWIAVEGPPSLILARMSRYFDILITGQFEGAIRHGGRALQPEDLIRRSGKPMIIVPQDYPVRPFREEAVVAWDGSLSAARALSDAMQILETKRSLDVVTVEDEEDRAAFPWLGDHDIIEHLGRHGIAAKRTPLKSRGGVGAAILEHCAASDPDVLVMGAFGRAKLGAILFGGVSTHILANQTVPVLMSH